MSYDIYLQVQAGTPKPDSFGYDWDGLADVHSQNYTSNCSPMWRAAGIDFHDWHGCLTRDMLPVLEAAIEKLKTEPARFQAMDSENGWGSYDTLVPWLEDLAAACRTYDLTTVGVSS